MRKQRSSRIRFFKTMDYPSGQKIWLGQWHYTHRYIDKWGHSVSSNYFRSIVTRPGQFGLFLDTPYYCYGGEHRYRKLATRLAVHIMICGLRGYLHDHIFRAKERLKFAYWRLGRRIKTLPEALRNRRAQRQFENLFRD